MRFVHLTEAGRDVAAETLLRVGRHQTEEVAGLGVVVAVEFAMVVTADFERCA